VQGLTEFLPISSSAHLRIVSEVFFDRDAGAAGGGSVSTGAGGAPSSEGRPWWRCQLSHNNSSDIAKTTHRKVRWKSMRSFIFLTFEARPGRAEARVAGRTHRPPRGPGRRRGTESGMPEVQAAAPIDDTLRDAQAHNHVRSLGPATVASLGAGLMAAWALQPLAGTEPTLAWPDPIAGLSTSKLGLHALNRGERVYRLLGCELVVRMAAQSEIPDRARAASGNRDHVVVFERRSAGLAPVPVLTHERALPAVARVHGALHGLRDVAGVLRRLGRLRRPGLLAHPELALLEIAHQQLERAIQHVGEIPVRELPPQQLLREPEPVVRGLRDRDLDRVALGRERRHACGWCGSEYRSSAGLRLGGRLGRGPHPRTRGCTHNSPRNDEDGLPPDRG